MTREETIAILQNMEYELSNQVASKYCRKQYDAVKTAIEVLEQERTGYWIKYDEGYYVIDRLKPVVHSIRECSECHTKIADFCGELKYCPDCKAKMERTVRG
jgi:hypothetical protein